MLRKGNDYYNEHHYRCYIYAGTNIGEEREVEDWTLTSPTTTLTIAPAFTAAVDATSQYELHRIFTEGEYRKAINMTIEAIAGKYLIDLKDETTIRLTSTTDNLGETKYTWEYALPTSFLYLYNIITEEAVAGIKLTGTMLGGTWTQGETVTGGTSGATGEMSYAGATYLRVRKVSGTFVTGETATGGSSAQTCAAITAVVSEPCGNNRFLKRDTIDPRDWSIIRAYAPKLKLHKGNYYINEDLYLRLEGQGAQATVSADTDVIYLPPDWVVQKAITFLPKGKIMSNQLDSTYQQALLLSAKEPSAWPNERAKRIVE